VTWHVASPGRWCQWRTGWPFSTPSMAMAWWSVCTGRSRMLYVHVARVRRGTPIYRGCYWAYVPHPRRILRYLQRFTGSSWTAPACARPTTCRRAAATHEAAVLCGGGQHTTGSLSQRGVRVCAGWRPAEAAGGPICRPLPGGLQGSEDLHHPGGQRQEIVSVDRLKPHTGSGPLTPAEAASRGRPPKMSAAPSIQPASS
jgi:hypothetical protein